jgi:hypothetical protein
MTAPSIAARAADVSSADFRAIRQVVDAYVAALRDGDEERLREAFHPQAIMAGYFNDEVLVLDMDRTATLVRSMAALAREEEPFRHELQSVLITDRVATVELLLYSFLGRDIRTCFHMIRDDGRWRIVAKLTMALGR